MYELIEEAKNGNKDAFTELIMSMEGNLYKIAKMKLQSDDDIDDAIQETMITAFKSIKKLKENKYFKTWIIKILINNCNNVYRKKKNVISIDDSFFESCFADNSFKSIDDDFNFNFLIKTLNYDERITLTLYYMEEYTTKEISKILDTSENTIKSRIARAKDKIKKNI